MTARRRVVQGIIPPIVLENLEQNAPTPEARRAARRSLLLSERVRGLREERAVEPNQGERREIHDAESTEELPGRRVRSEDEPATDDQEVDEAYDGSGSTYALYHDQFSRKSLDDAGMTLVSTVHFGRGFDNAFWDGQQMVYGDGNYFNPFTRSLSVIGHELTHGVVQHTCGLVYRDQPGALNEHLADVFGVLVVQQVLGLAPSEDRAWLVGAELVAGRIRGRALRDMLHGDAYNDPVIGRDESRTHMRDYYSGPQDNGGVHINSGIPNRAFALAARLCPGFAWASLGPVWYRTMVERIGPRATFLEFCAATYAVAQEMGKPSEVVAAIQEGWHQVGLDVKAVPAPAPPRPQDPSPCEDLFRELAKDPVARQALADLMTRPVARKLAARARLLTKEASI